jgi:hypothetical protein
MDEISEAAARVTRGGTVPELLDAGFAAFEAIRLAARACEERAPELFAAFMTAAGRAVEGRNALYHAPSFPLGHDGRLPAAGPGTTTGAAQVADQFAALAALVAQCLGSVEAALPGDRAACQRGAQAATEIWRLLATDADECDETVSG